MFFLLIFIFIPLDVLAQTTMENLLPKSIEKWKSLEQPQYYKGEEIFDYMDGAGEIYKAYNFKELLVQRYTRFDQEEILVEVFDMGLSKNAFGVFTYMLGRGVKVQIGQEGEYKSGLLNFWRDNYFVCVKVENENEDAKKAVFKLGKLISEAIRVDGDKPKILKNLPIGKYFPNTLRYFFNYEILNIHFYVADKNILSINDDTEGVLVRLKNDKSYLLLINYADNERADSAYISFLKHYMPDSKVQGIVKTENKKWTVCEKYNSFLIINFDAISQKQAKKIIETVKKRLI